MARFHGIGANCIAALLGTVTPFCSCSSIPLFIGFTSAGLPLGVTFSFLIWSPMVDLGSLVKEKEIMSCCSGANCTPEEMVKAEESKRNGGIKVLGGGCAKCHELEADAVAALKELGMDDMVELITDFAVIASYGVMSTMYHTFKTE